MYESELLARSTTYKKFKYSSNTSATHIQTSYLTSPVGLIAENTDADEDAASRNDLDDLGC